MPYIKESARETIDEYRVPQTPGELNYLLTMACIRYVDNEGISYSSINEIIGVLECCKLEFYRRLAAHYEDIKIHENGDVYPV